MSAIDNEIRDDLRLSVAEEGSPSSLDDIEATADFDSGVLPDDFGVLANQAPRNRSSRFLSAGNG